MEEPYIKTSTISIKRYWEKGKIFNKSPKIKTNLTCTGQYSNGKFNGQCTIVDSKGNKVYEGILKNNICDVKGVMYRNNKVLYVGELKNGLPHGFGVLTDDEKRYIGEFQEGLQCGKGKLYYNNQLIYKGEFSRGLRHGFGIQYYDTSDSNAPRVLHYEGDFKNSVFEGNGKLYNQNGILYYEGEIKNGNPDGKGIMYTTAEVESSDDNKNMFNFMSVPSKIMDSVPTRNNKKKHVKIVGEFKKGVINGEAQIYNKKGILIREGTYVKGVLHGRGKVYRKGKLLMDCEYRNGKMNGYGTWYHDDNSILYQGQLRDHMFHGQGTLIIGNKDHIVTKYIGEFKNNAFHGEGTLYYSSDQILYKGSWKHGVHDGYGVQYNKGLLEYDGEWKDSEYHGKGTQYDNKGNMIYKGMFVNSQRYGLGIEYVDGEHSVGMWVNDVKVNTFKCPCGNSNTDIAFSCNKCNGEFYCSRECKVKYWKDHKTTCKSCN